MINRFICVIAVFSALLVSACQTENGNIQDDRTFWLETMDRIARPVISNLAEGTLRQNMPFESLSDDPLRKEVSYLEAFGRTVCGIGPWLALGPDESEEGQLRAEYIDMVCRALSNAVDPASPDHLCFDNRHTQPLVDAAFLAQGILRAGDQIWDRLDEQTKANYIRELKTSRSIRPFESNWLLFASMVEAAILEYTGECDMERLTYGVRRFMEDGWYKGDGLYGDGFDFHMDYYNSLVIHPMLTDVMEIMVKHGLMEAYPLDQQLIRESRYASILEKFISPEGTFPVVGRSIVYRSGHLHALAHVALMQKLDPAISAAQVRSAMTAVLRNQFASPDNFDGEWLTIGFAGHQINMSEAYINTGSTYLCLAAFLPLGLPADNEFWASPAQDWTSRKAWNGVDVGADKAIRD